MSDPMMVVEPPVRGEWGIFNPPGHAPRAFDFLAVQGQRNPYRNSTIWRHLLGSIAVTQTLAWGQPVYAVAAGIVVAAVDGQRDGLKLSMLRDLWRLWRHGPPLQAPFEHLGGNHVILDVGGAYPLYAHLRQGSVRVQPGQRVRVGDVLGEVGNSGASLQPHLHFQIMTSADPFPLFQNLRPFLLLRAECRHDGQWHAQTQVPPTNGAHYRFA